MGRARQAFTPEQIRRVPRRTFCLTKLRDGQEAVISRVLSGLSTLALMPTGAGKSLCYQLPAMLLEGRTVVISPLIALMKDQCDALDDLGVAAVQLHSGLGATELASNAAIADGSARIVFTTPEQLMHPEFIEALGSSQRVALLVVDEAHCLSQWGFDFRPAFLEIGNARESLGRPPGRAAGEPVGLYHGRLSAAKRHAAQDAFFSGAVRVMVATNAFGLGIDKPDIRFVIHHQMPPGLDAYCQESGRAGRDGETAVCALLFSDRAVQQFFLSGRYPQLNEFRAVVDKLGDTPPDDEGWELDALIDRLRCRRKVAVAVNVLRQHAMVAPDAEGRLSLLDGDIRTADLEPLAEACEAKAVRDRAMLERMIAYAQSGQCRWRLLLEHLDGAPVTKRCRTCDNCLRLAAHEAAADMETSGSSEPIVVPQTPAFAVGSRVRTRRHGHAEVIASDTLSVTVVFENGQTRSFQPQFLGPAAARRRAPEVKAPHSPLS